MVTSVKNPKGKDHYTYLNTLLNLEEDTAEEDETLSEGGMRLNG